MKKKKEELEKEIEELLKIAEAVDEEEDKKYGKGKSGWDLPDELKGRGTRVEKIKAAMSALGEEARQEVAEKQKEKEAQKKSQKGFCQPACRGTQRFGPEKFHRSRFPGL